MVIDKCVIIFTLEIDPSCLVMSDPLCYAKQSNNWTVIKDKKLMEWQQQSRLHSLGHGRAQEIYTKKNDRILIPSIGLGAIAVFMDGMALIFPDQHIPLVIAALLLTAMGTILDGVLQATKPVEEASEHEDMAKGYNKIILQIDSVLAKEYNERLNGSSFITKIEEELIALKTGGVKIPASVWTTVKKDFTAGECDFQQLKGGAGRPFRHTIELLVDKSSQNLNSSQCQPPNPTLPQNPSSSSSTSTSTGASAGVGPEIDEQTIIDVDASIPRFELRIDDDPKTRKMEHMFFDFEMSRFG
jgi:hypothetical protein